MAIMLLGVWLSALSVSTTGSGGECIAPTPLGCFQDPYKDTAGKSRPVLAHKVASTSPKMTPLACVALCCGKGFTAGSIAGVEAGGDCYCDHGFGPYTIPQTHNCTTPCTGDRSQKCGGTGDLSAFGITKCPGDDQPLWRAAAAPPPPMQHCGAESCTACPAEDTCCKGKSPDSYKVPGGFGCSPSAPLAKGCASGGSGSTAGLPAGRCCCGLGPPFLSTAMPNVLVIGDSVSEGYIPYVKAALNGTANVGHGPDNAGGGAADGAAYGKRQLL